MRKTRSYPLIFPNLHSKFRPVVNSLNLLLNRVFSCLPSFKVWWLFFHYFIEDIRNGDLKEGGIEAPVSSATTDSKKEFNSVLADGVIQCYDDHEDSVYVAEWSSADPWTFASLSYDGRLVVNQVPRNIKFKILNLV